MVQLRILLVDDRPLLMRSVSRLLRPHVTVEVENPLLALQVALSGSVDAVLCDGRMPEMSGLELGDALLSFGWSRSRLAFMTGCDFTEQALLARGHVVLEKPFPTGALSALVRRWEEDLVADVSLPNARRDAPRIGSRA